MLWLFQQYHFQLYPTCILNLCLLESRIEECMLNNTNLVLMSPSLCTHSIMRDGCSSELKYNFLCSQTCHEVFSFAKIFLKFDLFAIDLTTKHYILSSPAKKPKVEKCSKKIQLILIALCCYHKCTWPSFVGREFLTENGFNEIDFHRMTQMCSWAVCGHHRLSSENGDYKNVSPTQRSYSTSVYDFLHICKAFVKSGM